MEEYKEDVIEDTTDNYLFHGSSSSDYDNLSGKKRRYNKELLKFKCLSYLNLDVLPKFKAAFQAQNVELILQICFDLDAKPLDILAFVRFPQIEELLSGHDFFKMLRILMNQDLDNLLPILRCIRTLIIYGSSELVHYFLSYNLLDRILTFISTKIYLSTSLSILSALTPHLSNFSFLEALDFEELIIEAQNEVEANQPQNIGEEEDLANNQGNYLMIDEDFDNVDHPYLSILNLVRALTRETKKSPPIIPMVSFLSMILHHDGLTYHHLSEITDTISTLLSTNSSFLGVMLDYDIFNILSTFLTDQLKKDYVQKLLLPFVYACKSSRYYENAMELRIQLFHDFNPFELYKNSLISIDFTTSEFNNYIYLCHSFLKIFGIPSIYQPQYFNENSGYSTTCLFMQLESQNLPLESDDVSQDIQDDDPFPKKIRQQPLEETGFDLFIQVIDFFKKQLFILGPFGVKFYLCKLFLFLTQSDNDIPLSQDESLQYLISYHIFDIDFVNSLIQYILAEQESIRSQQALQLLLNILELIQTDPYVFNEVVNKYLQNSHIFHDMIDFFRELDDPIFYSYLEQLDNFLSPQENNLDDF